MASKQSSTGGFSSGGTPSTSGGVFGSSSQAGTSSLFSTSASGSTFGAKPGRFGGFGVTTSQASPPGMFGFGGFGVTTSQASSPGMFGSTTGTTGLFGQAGGTSAFGRGVAVAGGTTLAFIPPLGQDAMMKGGVSTNIDTRHNCITAMKEYENKSLEELRSEDYGANRKSKQAGSTSTGGLSGQAPASQASGSGFMFGGASGLGTSLQSSTTGFGTGLQSSCTGFGGHVESNCITAMKEYGNKSLEELRFEDYGANRQSKQAGSTSTGGLSGQAPASQASGSVFMFGGGSGLGAGLQSSTTGFGTELQSSCTGFGGKQTMGYDLDRFPDQTVDTELICSICHLVMNCPLEIRKCQHVFCRECIKEWMLKSKTCPIDRRDITDEDLFPANRVFSILLSRLKITCENKHLGCNEQISLEQLSTHQEECKHNQDNEIECDKKCRLKIKVRDMEDHDCAEQLLEKVSSLQKSITVNVEKIEMVTQQKEQQAGLLSEQRSKIKRYQEEETRMKNSIMEIVTHLKPLLALTHGAAGDHTNLNDMKTLEVIDNNTNITITDINNQSSAVSIELVTPEPAAITQTTSSLSLVSASSYESYRRRCWNCGSPHHLKWECPSGHKIRCFTCHERGHKAMYCDENSEEEFSSVATTITTVGDQNERS